MTFKNITIALLLVPCMALGKNSSDSRMQQLKNDFHVKELELYELEKMIAEKEEHLDTMMERCSYVYSSIYEQLDNKGQEEFKEEVHALRLNIERAIDIQNEIKGVSAKHLIDRGTNNENELERLRFALIRQAIQHIALKELFKRYEKLLEQFLTIKNELECLQNNVHLN